jgi:hypothetical protein
MSKPAEITEMDATDLIGRLVHNENGAAFVVTGLAFTASTASVVIRMEGLDDEGEPDGDEVGLWALSGWTIGHKLTGGL